MTPCHLRVFTPTDGMIMDRERKVISGFLAAHATLAQEASETAVHGYRIAARRLQSLLALWRPLIYKPKLERRLARAINRLSALRDAQVHALRFGGEVQVDSRKLDLPDLAADLRDWRQRCEEWGCQPCVGEIYAMYLGQGLLEHIDIEGRWTPRHWHRLRLMVKEARYGCELLVQGGQASPSWLAGLSEWQERLGQLQDRRQWLKRLPEEALKDEERAARQHTLERQMKIRCRELASWLPALRELALKLLRSGAAAG